MSIGSDFESQFKLKVEALVLAKLTNSLPRTTVNQSKKFHFKELVLGDRILHEMAPIDILIGRRNKKFR